MKELELELSSWASPELLTLEIVHGLNQW
jgi:hypothetical protein